jgi:hypothetical protein
LIAKTVLTKCAKQHTTTKRAVIFWPTGGGSGARRIQSHAMRFRAHGFTLSKYECRPPASS